MDRVRKIADAVLYEGYILWPYTRSALKNQQRWTFGGVYPQAWSADRDDDPSSMQTQCLIEADDAAGVEIRVRFLHIVARQPFEYRDGAAVAVDELDLGSERHLAWQEATEREVSLEGLRLGELGSPREVEIRVGAGSAEEELIDVAGQPAGQVTRSWRELDGTLTVRADELDAGLYRISVLIENSTQFDSESRERALEQTFCSCHTVLETRDGAFVSITDPPDHARAAAEACENSGTWPVLAGEQGDRTIVLSSPIVLPDYPQIAPESPGDLFDGGEIDQMLVLNILSLTDEEKREMRDSDPRAREILERTEGLSEEQLMRLHGAIRELAVRGG